MCTPHMASSSLLLFFMATQLVCLRFCCCCCCSFVVAVVLEGVDIVSFVSVHPAVDGGVFGLNCAVFDQSGLKSCLVVFFSTWEEEKGEMGLLVPHDM